MQPTSISPVPARAEADVDGAETVKPAFQEPKLTFVKPKLVREGDFGQITAGFFGTFTP